MKLPIITTKTSYVEFDTPCYYQSKYGSFYKIYETGMLSVYKEMIDNYYILDAKGNPDEFTVNKVVYVKTCPNKCHDRILNRARDGENNIPLEYLKNCNLDVMILED